MRPPPHAGLRHLALNARHLDEMKRFYVDVLGFSVEWEPDEDNVYLSSGLDNLALHRTNAASAPSAVPPLSAGSGTSPPDHLCLSPPHAEALARRAALFR